MLHRIFLAVLLAATAFAQSSPKVLGGPFTVGVTDRNATVVYIVEGPEVQLSASPGKPVRKTRPLRAEKVSFAGLQPNTTYTYNVLGTEQGKGQFKTAPAERASFNFVAYGDTRTRHHVHRQVVEAIAKVNPDFLIHTGDLVNTGDDTADWIEFFTISQDLFRKASFYPSLGNHERNSSYYHEFFPRPHMYYSFNWGAVHFTVLNSDIGNVSPNKAVRDAFWDEQIKWLEDDLASHQKSDFRFVVMHHPPFTAVKRRQRPSSYLDPLLPIFEKYKVTAVLLGHDHNYQHHLKNGVRYIITGGGGAPLYETDAPIEGITQKVATTENFVLVKVDGNRAVLEAHDIKGNIIDRIEFKP